jgi:phosphohistidine phosphatase
MILYLCRHGIAADYSASGADEDRALTEDGMRKMRKAAHGLKVLDDNITHIFTSPLLRARQTAQILAEELGTAPIAVLPALGPPGHRRMLLNHLGDLSGKPKVGNVIAVGHEPTMSEWTRAICFGDTGPEMFFKRGAMAAIELDDAERGTLRWYLTNSVLRHVR